jgi:hypothetical protein
MSMGLTPATVPQPARRTTLALLLACTLTANPATTRTVTAQSSHFRAPAPSPTEPPGRTPRRKIFAIAGAIIGAAAGIGYAKASQSDSHGGCFGIQCVIVASTVGGAVFGYLIGREYDLTYASRFRGVQPLRPRSIGIGLEGEPVAIAVSDSTIAVAGSIGVQLFRISEGDLRGQARRAGGLRGISTVALAPRTEWIALGSPVGLYLFPPQRGPGMLIRSGDVGTAATSPEHVYFGVDRRIEVAPLAEDSVRTWPGITISEPVRDLALDTARSLLWAVTDRDLIALRPSGDSLERVGAAMLTGAGRALAITHDTAIVALGERGIQLFDTSDPAAPRPLESWTIAHFAYDVSVDRGRLFVAAGPEGVYVLELQGGELRTLGLARSLGFASALASHDGYTYILDRRSNTLRRIPSDF